MIHVGERPDGIVIAVRAQPGAKKNAVIGEHDAALKVAVTAPPDKGKANEAIAELLAESFGVSKSAVEIVSGHTSRQKKFFIRGILAATAEHMLAELLAR